MEFDEILYEYKVHKMDLGRKEIIVVQNPSREQLLNRLSENAYQRGVIIEKDIYVWRAYDAVHMDILQVFAAQGIEYRDMSTFILWKDGFGGIELDDIDNRKIISHPTFERMTRNLKIYELEQ